MIQPFRVATIECPRCRTTLGDGELRHCSGCEGAWIPHETLVEHVGKMQLDEPRLAWAAATDRLGLPCPVCRHRMEPLHLFEVPVDRCHSHGVWFDKHELAEALRRSAGHVRRPDGSRVDSAQLAADVGDAGVLTAVEAVVDVIGGLFSALDF